MDPVHPWLDPIEVRRLAERLLQPVQQPAVQVMEAGFGEQFVGYSPVSPLDIQAPPAPVPTAPVPAPEPAPAPLPQATVVEEEPPAPEPPAPRTEVRGPFLDRVGRFRDWLHRHFAATGIFLLDREGAVIFDESGHGKLHFLARSLAVASRRPGGAAANVHVKVGAAATLEVIPVDTPYGCLVLGAVVPAPLEPPAVAAVMEALKSVASPQA
ncbi:hypothetical protein [Luteolibacter sp. LG18]|uniref:hypothetical protein n=1 Tax=Luteolibacter sp. LG18 TaxID=2819286 RepID=UPI002B2898A8|nr:hypothetical protein llg_22060 [Luteolibacter sp. LG18]